MRVHVVHQAGMYFCALISFEGNTYLQAGFAKGNTITGAMLSWGIPTHDCRVPAKDARSICNNVRQMLTIRSVYGFCTGSVDHARVMRKLTELQH